MQYYRLWIYSCNVVLGITSAIFIIFAAFVVADVRLSLLEGVELYHPTFFYAYGALIVQCGVIQTIGCLGAQRLSHKLLSLYWTLLLLLTLGDIGVGLYWVFHLEKVKINLRPYLSREFIERYSTDETFTLRWNKLQSQDRCCGVNGPLDFEKFSTSQLLHSKQAAFPENSHHVIVGVESGLLSLPESCCTHLYVPATLGSSSSSGSSLDKTYRVSNHPSEEEHPAYNDHSPDSSSSVIPNDEHHSNPSDFAGGGRAGRTVVNMTHKKNEASLDDSPDEDEDDEEEEEDNEMETQAYMDYIQDFPYHKSKHLIDKPLEQLAPAPNPVVPDNDPSGFGRHKNELTLRVGKVRNRDIITSYEPNHAHKLRHELHRKSQPSSSLIDVQKLVSSTPLVLAATRRTETNGSVGEIDELREEDRDHQPRNKISRWRAAEGYYRRRGPASIRGELIRIKNQEIYLPQHHNHPNHRHQSHNKTNKLFPSIAFPVRRRKRRETRALSVTQVPAVSAPIQRRIVCHTQPEGLNHHNSYKKQDLFDQTKTRKDKEGEGKTLESTKKPGADWLYQRTTNRTSKPSPVHPSSQVELQPSVEAQLTSAEITERLGAPQIEKLTKAQRRRKSLLAIRNSQRIMTGSAAAEPPPSSSFHFLKLVESLSSPSQKRRTTANKIVESLTRRRRSPRNAEMNRDNSDPTLQSRPFHGISKRSTFTYQDDDDHGDRSMGSPKTGHNSETLAEPYFSPLSSSSSTSQLEVDHPQSAIVSPSTSPYDQWQENDEFTGESNVGNSSSGDVQKKLYVYGVGCGVKLIEWVDHVSGIMFIIGFCIICFAKTCFLVILRTEIQEMIEKINMIEPEEVMSPSRNPSKVSHPLLQNPHRSSTTSAHCALLPTIKSPDGPSTSLISSGVMGGGYNRPNRHYLRRASNIVGGDRSRSHSNETVNMTLLMTSSHDSGGRERQRSNPNLSNPGGGSTGTISNLDEKDPVSGLSITVPSGGSTTGSSCAAMGAARYLRRSSTCTTSANSYYPYGYGYEMEPRAGPSSRFYQYFEPIYQTPHLYQQHHRSRNRSHSRNMSCGAILPLASVRSNSVAATYRGLRNLSSTTTTTTTTNMPTSGGYCSYGSTSRDENEMIISVSLEHIASSDQDEDADATRASAIIDEAEEIQELEKKEWAAATSSLEKSEEGKSSSNAEDCVGTKLQTFTHTEHINETIRGNNDCAELPSREGESEREFQRRNGNNNVDLTNGLPMSYIGTPV